MKVKTPVRVGDKVYQSKLIGSMTEFLDKNDFPYFRVEIERDLLEECLRDQDYSNIK